MKRLPFALACALSGLAAHLLMLSGALAWAPPGVRVAAALAVLVLVPGHGWLAAIGARPPGGRWLSTGWALGLGVAWLGALVLATRAAHVPFTRLAGWAALPNLLPWAIVAVRPGERERARPGETLGHVALVAVFAAAALACLHVARVPTPVSYYTDSPDHIGTIRRMMTEGDAFPTDAFFRGAGSMGADPRKGLWHPCVALIALLARVDALAAWRALAALLAPLFVLNAAAFAFLLGGSAAAAVGAWALLLTYGGSLGTQYLREAVFATKLGDQLALATAAAVLADLDLRRSSSRLAAVALALGAVAAHVFAALHFAVAFGALGVGLLVRDRAFGPALRRLVPTVLALGLACLPYLLWRQHVSYAPNNPIHLDPQGLLVLAPGVTVVSGGVLWDWFGSAWLLFPLSWWAMARAASRPAVLYLLASSVAVALILFCPPLVALLQPRLGYLLMRFVWLLPLSGALAFALPALVRRASAGGAPARFAGFAGLAGVLLLLAPALRDAAVVLLRPADARAADAPASVLRWRVPMAWMDAHLPAGSVVLSDPATSYAVPMLTRHWVTTLVDQHSSPNDSLALARILDARDALDPGEPYARLRAVVHRWGATAIVLNDRFGEAPRLDYWAPAHDWFVRARARLDAAPAAFRRVYDDGAFVVYEIAPAALDTLRGGALARGYVRAWRPVPGAKVLPAGPGMPDIAGFTLSASRARPGDSLGVAIDWHARSPMPAGAYAIALRFDRPLPPGLVPPAWCAKPARKLLERIRHERYRFRVDHVPVRGDYGVDRWRPDEAVRDSFGFAVPADAAPGDYQVQLVMLRQPHYPNYHLGDYFLDHDYYSGDPVGVLRVERAAGR